MALNIQQYTDRVNASGSDSNSSVINSTISAIQSSFTSMPAYKLVLIDDVEQGVHIITHSSYGTTPESTILKSYPSETFDVGQYVVVDGDSDWLITSKKEDETIQASGLIKRCNVDVKIQIGKVETIVGYDELGRPITEDVYTYYEHPAIYSDKTSSVSDSDLENGVNVPFGYITVQCKYDQTEMIPKDSEFELFGIKFVVARIDYSNIIDNVGTVTLIAKEVVK